MPLMPAPPMPTKCTGWGKLWLAASVIVSLVPS